MFDSEKIKCSSVEMLVSYNDLKLERMLVRNSIFRISAHLVTPRHIFVTKAR